MAFNIAPKILCKIIRMLLSIIRTIPSLVYGIMIIIVTSSRPFAVVVIFSIVSIGMVSKIYIEDIKEISSGLFSILKIFGLSREQ